MDRGIFSVECMLLLLALKVTSPQSIILLRGNHECRQMTTSFTFRQEVLLKYDQEVFEAFCDVFDYLPLACVINGKFIALHAGLSPELKTTSDINKIDRFNGGLTRDPQERHVLRHSLGGPGRERRRQGGQPLPVQPQPELLLHFRRRGHFEVPEPQQADEPHQVG